MTRRAVSGALVVMSLGLAFAREASAADVFRYVDREGRAHTIRVPEGGSSEEPAAPEPSARAAQVVSAAAFGEAFGGIPALYTAFAAEAAELYGLPVELIYAVMRVESAFNPGAVSSAGAMGLMQLMPSTAADLGVLNPFDPHENILGGAHQLRILVNGFGGDVAVALAAYHAGSRAIRRHGGVAPMPETRRYVVDVLHYYRMYRGGDAATVLRVPSARATRAER